MLIVDYIVDTRDHHGANIEVLTNLTESRLAPIYDTGYSLFSPVNPISNYGLKYIEYEGPNNNFLISLFWSDVLYKLKGEITLPAVNPNDLYFDDLAKYFDEDITDLLNICKNVIIGRYEYARSILCS